MVTAEKQESRSYAHIAVGGGCAFGVLTAGVAVLLIGSIWSTCDIGSNASANSFTLLLVVPVAWLGSALVWGISYSLLARVDRRLALIVASLLGIVLLWYVVVRLGTIGDYPDPVCPGNVPRWWPDFIPT